MSFEQYFLELCEWYGKKPSKRAYKTYATQLESLTDEQWEQAIDWAYSNHQFMPTPKMLFESVNSGLDAESVWAELLQATQKLSAYRYDSFFRTHKAEIMGELSQEAIDFIADTKLDLLALGDMPEPGAKGVKFSLERFLKNRNPSQSARARVLEEIGTKNKKQLGGRE